MYHVYRVASVICLVWLSAWVPVSAFQQTSVKDFGAAGDGISDDTEALERALNSGTVAHLPQGRYVISRPIGVKKDGSGLSGPGTLVIPEFDVGPNKNFLAIYVTANNVRFEGLAMEKVFVDGSYGTGIFAERTRGLTLRNLEFSGFSVRFGVRIVESSDFVVAGCYFHDFYVNTAADMIQDSPAALNVTRSMRGVIEGNRVRRIDVGPVARASISPLSPNYGPQTHQSDCMAIQDSREMTITGNILATCGEGIDMLLSESFTMTGNSIRDIWFLGIKLLGASFATVTGNDLLDCFSGIGMDSGHGRDAVGNAITGNVIRNTGAPGSWGRLPERVAQPYAGWGVVVDGASDFNLVTRNTILDTQTAKTMQPQGIRLNRQNGNLIKDNLINSALVYDNPVAVAPPPLAPLVEFTPGILRFTAAVNGAAPASQVLKVRGGSANSEATVRVSGASWLLAQAQGASIPADVTVTVDTKGLPAGTYRAWVVISVPSAGGPYLIPVILTVSG